MTTNDSAEGFIQRGAGAGRIGQAHAIGSIPKIMLGRLGEPADDRRLPDPRRPADDDDRDRLGDRPCLHGQLGEADDLAFPEPRCGTRDGCRPDGRALLPVQFIEHAVVQSPQPAEVGDIRRKDNALLGRVGLASGHEADDELPGRDLLPG